jgi:hypothetical protein
MLAAIALGVTMLSSTSAKKAVKTAHSGQTPGGHHLTRPMGPSQMWVDRPINTVLRNDAQADNPAKIDSYIRQTYMTEAASHPGVRLVAGQAYV